MKVRRRQRSKAEITEELTRLKAAFNGSVSKVEAFIPPEKPAFFAEKFLTRKEFLEKFGKHLNENLPKSERWFWQEYEQRNMVDRNDLPNHPFMNSIPDIVNHHYKYVIEIQDPTHLHWHRRKSDAWKHKEWKKAGYAVFEVWAWKETSFGLFVTRMTDYRKRFHERLSSCDF